MSVTAAILLATTDLQFDAEPLALTPWRGDDTLLEWQIAELQEAGVNVIEVVLGYESERIIPFVAANDVEPIVDPAWRDGAASSLRVGASAVPRDTERALIIDIREPRPASVCARLLEAHEDGSHAIVVPSYGGTIGRPIVAGPEALAAVRNLAPGHDISNVLDAFSQSVRSIAFDTDVVRASITDRASCEAVRVRMAGEG